MDNVQDCDSYTDKSKLNSDIFWLIDYILIVS
jgi:hypothetical protein